mgnify:CR=1 FL=1
MVAGRNKVGGTSLFWGLESAGVSDDIRAGMVKVLPRLRRFAFSLTGNRDQADDLVQEVCARALARKDQWQPGSRLDSWMYRIAQNIWLDRCRSNAIRGATVDLDSQLEVSGSDGRDIVETRLTLGAVAVGVKVPVTTRPSLPAATNHLVCIEGLSYKDAASVLELPIGTVMSRLARARKALHDALYADPVPIPTVQTRGGRRG